MERLPPGPKDAESQPPWGRRRKYGDELPKPTEIRTSEQFPWHQVRVYGAGRLHDLRYKIGTNVLWRSGSRTRPLRLLVIAPLGYRRTKKSRLLYRDPAYLLTTDLSTAPDILIQAYFDRWEIEVNHRDEKSLLGAGDAQVWSAKAAWRVPKWDRREVRRPSVLDILALLREELLQRGVAAPKSNSVTDGKGAIPGIRMPRAG